MRLSLLKMNSEQRRMERYRIIYTWKAVESIVPECGIKVKSNHDSRFGRSCELPRIARKASQRVISIREQSFQVHGPRLFNSLPKSIRNLTNCTVDQFKARLDKFLTCIPDQPLVGELIPPPISQITGRHSNSLIDQIRDFQQRTRGAGQLEEILEE